MVAVAQALPRLTGLLTIRVSRNDADAVGDDTWTALARATAVRATRASACLTQPAIGAALPHKDFRRPLLVVAMKEGQAQQGTKWSGGRHGFEFLGERGGYSEFCLTHARLEAAGLCGGE